jgi:perosamine synthetase
MITAVLDAALGLDKETVLEQLRARGIDGRPFFYPLSALPAYAETAGVATARRRNRIAADVSRRGVNLPSALKLGRDDVAVAARALREIVSTSGRPVRPG